MNYIIFFLIPFLIYFLNSHFAKNENFLNFSGEAHQKILGKKKHTFDRWNISDFIFTYRIF